MCDHKDMTKLNLLVNLLIVFITQKATWWQTKGKFEMERKPPFSWSRFEPQASARSDREGRALASTSAGASCQRGHGRGARSGTDCRGSESSGGDRGLVRRPGGGRWRLRARREAAPHRRNPPLPAAACTHATSLSLSIRPWPTPRSQTVSPDFFSPKPLLGDPRYRIIIPIRIVFVFYFTFKFNYFNNWAWYWNKIKNKSQKISFILLPWYNNDISCRLFNIMKIHTL